MKNNLLDESAIHEKNTYKLTFICSYSKKMKMINTHAKNLSCLLLMCHLSSMNFRTEAISMYGVTLWTLCPQSDTMSLGLCYTTDVLNWVLLWRNRDFLLVTSIPKPGKFVRLLILSWILRIDLRCWLYNYNLVVQF